MITKSESSLKEVVANLKIPFNYGGKEFVMPIEITNSILCKNSFSIDGTEVNFDFLNKMKQAVKPMIKHRLKCTVHIRTTPKEFHSTISYISRFVYSKLKDLYFEKYNLTWEDYSLITKIISRGYWKRLHPTLRNGIKKNKKYGSGLGSELKVLLTLKQNCSKQEWSYICSDLLKFPQAMCRYIIENFCPELLCDRPEILNFETYQSIVKKCPDLIKKNIYNLSFGFGHFNFVDIHNIKPKNRFEYFMVWVLSPSYYEYMGKKDGIKNIDLYKKLNIKHWHLFKKAYHINSPYNKNHLSHMINVIKDGQNIYKRIKEQQNVQIRHHEEFNEIKVFPVEGSGTKMLNRAIWNHRQEQKLQLNKMLTQKNTPMPLPPIELPQWIEDIRLKTQHDMITAGRECHHCIGSYTNSKDIFVRQGNICAQIDRDSLQVRQCYDYHDTITKQSEELERKLNRTFKKLKEDNNVKLSQPVIRQDTRAVLA